MTQKMNCPTIKMYKSIANDPRIGCTYPCNGVCATNCGVFHTKKNSQIERAIGSSREKLDPQPLRSDTIGGNVPPPDDPRPYMPSMQFGEALETKGIEQIINLAHVSTMLPLRVIGAVCIYD